MHYVQVKNCRNELEKESKKENSEDRIEGNQKVMKRVENLKKSLWKQVGNVSVKIV